MAIPFGHFKSLLGQDANLYGRPSGRPVGTTNQGYKTTHPGYSPTYAGRTEEQPTPANPILGGLQHSGLQDILGDLRQPIDIPTGRTTQELQGLYNQLRGQIQGGTATELEQARTYMGGRGFRSGESGIADRPMMQIARGGQERLAGAAQNVYLDEARRRFGEEAQLGGLNLQRLLGAGGLAAGSERDAMNMLMSMYGLQTGAQQARWQPYWSALTSAYGG